MQCEVAWIGHGGRRRASWLRADAQPGHDAFDKPLGYDNGREERAAHNYLNQTGEEDAYGDSQVAPNQSQYGNNSGTQLRWRSEPISSANRQQSKPDNGQ